MGNLVDLATRSGGGIEVALIWDREERTLVVFAHDATTSEEVVIPVRGEEATEVYRHPFAYAHRSADADGQSGSAVSRSTYAAESSS
jgi:hypothetical protein